MHDTPVILITGTSTGIGRSAVEHLAARGCHVVATARKPSDISDLEHERVDTLELDVTKEATMQAAVDTTLERYGRIDGLVNNAGYGVMLPQEEMPMDALRRMYEVNVFGLQRLTQMVLPIMREQEPRPRYGRGRIVNVASVAGHISFPMLGAYCSTKFAVRALTTALAGEVRPFGIHASLIEPGSIKTDFAKRAMTETDTWGADIEGSPYGNLHRNWNRIRQKAGGTLGAGPDLIARKITHACTARRPRFRYLTPMDARAGRFASKFLPDPVVSRGAGAYFNRGNGKS